MSTDRNCYICNRELPDYYYGATRYYLPFYEGNVVPDGNEHCCFEVCRDCHEEHTENDLL